LAVKTPVISGTAFDLGKLYCDRGDYDKAIRVLSKAAQELLERKDMDQYLKCHNLLLRMYVEMQDHESVNRLKDGLQDLVIKSGVGITSKTYYTLGVCALYKSQGDVALDYFQKALSMGLAADHKEDICYAIGGIANVYVLQDRYQDALKEVYNLKVFFQVFKNAELELSTSILNARILCHLGKFDDALEIYWECYDLLRSEKNIYLYVFLLFGMGLAYKQKGEAELSQLYLNLARRTVDDRFMKWLTSQIDEELMSLSPAGSLDFDLVLDTASNSVIEKKKGRVDFRSQFILLDLLHLFMRQPGQIISKEALVKSIWRQDYNPDVHDNKVYVTIKRLRRMIEPDFDKPKYIFRAKNGYYLNKNNRIFVEKH
jgi:DNA-binding winged helix-turn-helix (wHTH) protein